MKKVKHCIICNAPHQNSMSKTCSLRCQSKHERLLKIAKQEKKLIKWTEIMEKKIVDNRKKNTKRHISPEVAYEVQARD